MEVVLTVLRKLSGQNICARNTDQVQAEFSHFTDIYYLCKRLNNRINDEAYIYHHDWIVV